MTYESVLLLAKRGRPVVIDLVNKTIKVGRKKIELETTSFDGTQEDIMCELERLYANYKRSIPSEASNRKRRNYFYALPLNELTDKDMVLNNPREYDRVCLEAFLLFAVASGRFKWNEEWGSWFYKSQADEDFVLLRKWF